MKIKAQIECDGGCNPNPGHGYGSFRCSMDGKVGQIHRKKFGDDFTNNLAEYQILIEAISHLGKFAELYKIDLCVVTDSSILVDFINRRKFLKNTPPRLQDMKRQLDLDLLKFGNVSGVWRGRESSVNLFGH